MQGIFTKFKDDNIQKNTINVQLRLIRVIFKNILNIMLNRTDNLIYVKLDIFIEI